MFVRVPFYIHIHKKESEKDGDKVGLPGLKSSKTCIDVKRAV